MKEAEVELPEHTQSMRRATQYCMDSLTRTTTTTSGECVLKWQVAGRNSDDCWRIRRRKAASDEFWKTCPQNRVVPQLRYSEIHSPRDFRERFHDLNLPCLIDFDELQNKCGESAWFGFIDQQWKYLDTTDNQRDGVVTVNRNWFVHALGANAKVPVRLQPLEAVALDDEGRAMECQSKDIPITEWIQMLNNPTSTGENADRVSFYLKDWHLLQQLQETQQQQQKDYTPALYDCPPIFQFDLLNSFLTRFTKGDYRFCYWGPRGSFTSRHSDVLHSFSWSYNVVGTKLWTFFRNTNTNPGDELNNPVDTEDKVEVIQRTGQAMFVPSQWQHEVVNLEETISINHNWVTTANLDQCWECLTTEMRDVEKELRSWNLHHDLEAQESMLRGCVGLDVTAFFLMCLVRLCDLLAGKPIEPHVNRSGMEDEKVSHSEMEQDFVRLLCMIGVLRQDERIHLQGRLYSVLQSTDLATNLVSAIDSLIDQYYIVDDSNSMLH